MIDPEENLTDEELQRRIIGLPTMRLNTPATLPAVVPPGVKQPQAMPKAALPPDSSPPSIAAPTSAYPELPSPSFANPTHTPTRLETLQGKLGDEENWKFGSKIANPWARGVLRGLDVVGSIVAPRIAAGIPGTTLHHQIEERGTQEEIANEEAQQQHEAQTAAQQSEIPLRVAQTGEAEARTKALENPPEKLGTIEKTDQGYFRIHPDGTAEPITVGGKPLMPPEGKQDEKQTAEDAWLSRPENKGKDRADAAKWYAGLSPQARQEFHIAAPRQEPGNYTPVTNRAGDVIGWVDPKSGHFRSISEIPGVGEALGGAGAIPAKPTVQERNADVQATLSHEKLPSVIAEIDALGKDPEIGPIMGRWNDFMQGKVGARNPQFAALRTDLLFLTSAIALMHAQGRLPENLREEFDRNINAPQQDPENLKAILRTADSWLTGRIGVLHPAQQVGGTISQPQSQGKWNPKIGRYE